MDPFIISSIMNKLSSNLSHQGFSGLANMSCTCSNTIISFAT